MSPADALTGTAPCTAGSAIGCAPDAVFKKAFGVYARIVEVGLLGHATLVAAAVGELQKLRAASPPGGAPLAVLDAGCGDAAALAASLAAAGGAALVGRYDGLDASPPALAAAQAAMGGALGGGAAVTTAVGDLLTHLEGAADALRQGGADGGGGGDDPAPSSPPSLPPSVVAMPPPPGGYDAIVATLAVHHLPTPAKARWLAAASACLAPGGVVVVGDVFLGAADEEQDQSAASCPQPVGGPVSPAVAAWRARNTALMRATWPAASGLPAAEVDALAAHVAACDLPESVATYEKMAGAAGLGGFAVVARVDPGACGGAVIPCTTVVGHKAKV